jgi:hypothetical protein
MAPLYDAAYLAGAGHDLDVLEARTDEEARQQLADVALRKCEVERDRGAGAVPSRPARRGLARHEGRVVDAWRAASASREPSVA